MRVAIIGGSGNAGTALLEALAAEAEVTSILGVARRLPDSAAVPYSEADWARFDVAARTTSAAEEANLIAGLAEILGEVDVVVHLAWLIQPNRERDLLRRANVDGTRRVLEACAQAGVRRVVVASSVGAYTGVGDNRMRDERHPTDGIATSHYSVDKSAQERVLEEFSQAHPEVSVAWLRPALIFQPRAGAEIHRYFLGRFVPAPLLRPGRLPVLPWPAGLRFQVVHADDVASAYVHAVFSGARGAFNIAADDVLYGDDVARIVNHGRVLTLPRGAVRKFLELAWRARLVPADAGWLDMGSWVPVLDTSRARKELGWRPRVGAAETLRQMLEGIADGAGTGSTPMRPRDGFAARGVHFTGQPNDSAGPELAEGELLHARFSGNVDRALLGLYLSDHLTGATAGVNRMSNMADRYQDLPIAQGLERLRDELVAERSFLVSLIESLGLPRRGHRQAAASVAERLGRLKLNGRVFTRSPMTPVFELEIMRAAVNAKVGSWQTLQSLAPELGLGAKQFTELAEQALEQSELLGRMHEQLQRSAFLRS